MNHSSCVMQYASEIRPLLLGLIYLVKPEHTDVNHIWLESAELSLCNLISLFRILHYIYC